MFPMKNLLLFLVIAATGLRAEVEFSGYFIAGGQELFALADGASGQVSGWLRAGESYRDTTIRSFDRGSEVLTVEAAGRLEKLPLRLPRVKDGRITITGAVTPLGQGSRREVRASFFLGEEQAFPLSDTVTLHLFIDRRADGNLLYRARSVTRDASGAEHEERLPIVLSLPGLSFSVKCGDIGFSFKP